MSGIAEVAATVQDQKTGKLITSADPAYGSSRESDGVVLLLFTSCHSDMGLDMTSDPVKVGTSKSARQ